MTPWSRIHWWVRYHRRSTTVAAVTAVAWIAAMVYFVGGSLGGSAKGLAVSVAPTGGPASATTTSSTSTTLYVLQAPSTTVKATATPPTTKPAARKPTKPKATTTTSSTSTTSTSTTSTTVKTPTSVATTTTVPRIVLHGAVTVHENGGMLVGNPSADCSQAPGFMGGFSSSYRGVLVTDTGGTTVASGAYGAGHYVNLHSVGGHTYADCQLSYSTTAVPTIATYRVVVGSNRPGNIDLYSFGQLAAAGWTENYTITDGSGWG